MKRARTTMPLKIGFLVAALLCAAKLGFQLTGVRPVFNFTISAPRGVYLVRPNSPVSIVRGEYVEFSVPPAFVPTIYGRGWLQPGTPLLKTVGGIPGDELCFRGQRFLLNNVDAGSVKRHDSQGKTLPILTGCKTVEEDYFLPISTFHANSFDGRYMGPIPNAFITGRAELLWTF